MIIRLLWRSKKRKEVGLQKQTRMLSRNLRREEGLLWKRIMQCVLQNPTMKMMHHLDLLKREGVDLRALTRRSKDHQKARLPRHAVVADQKRQKRNPKSLVKMKTIRMRRRKKKKTEPFENAIGEDEINTSDLSFEDPSQKNKTKPVDQSLVLSKFTFIVVIRRFSSKILKCD